ncbi:TetR/AcrR family transcriptional regulator [Fodinicola feengrottensis]|uniref:TetR/AcrR family transcriptional regulator n=1 Tax=Fodinicola feengrottensis TaxID=435914 RepID=A0ABN2FWW1_9ACTN
MDSERPGRRPANRRRQLVVLAADLFAQRGYQAVSIEDIASAAGITGPALYRHFQGKQDLLAQVLLTGQEVMDEAAEQALGGAGTPAERLDAVTLALAEQSVQRRGVSALWRWQARHLDETARNEVRQRGRKFITRWAGELTLVRPDLPAADAELLCMAALSVLGSVADHHASLPKRRFVALLHTLASAVCASSCVPAESGEATGFVAEPVIPATRREQILAAATELFVQRGYRAVSMEDIGAAAGIAGPSVYRHFASKADLLMAGCGRLADQLAVGASRALSGAGEPAAQLDRLIRSYVDVVMDHGELLHVYNRELAHLPERSRLESLRVQRAYVAQWVGLQSSLSPDASQSESRIAVHAALTIINDLSRSGRLRARPAIGAELTALAHTVLSAAQNFVRK